MVHASDADPDEEPDDDALPEDEPDDDALPDDEPDASSDPEEEPEEDAVPDDEPEEDDAVPDDEPDASPAASSADPEDDPELPPPLELLEHAPAIVAADAPIPSTTITLNSFLVVFKASPLGKATTRLSRGKGPSGQCRCPEARQPPRYKKTGSAPAP